MRIVISGSTGLIGQALTASLLGDGHDVVRLVRHEPGPALSEAATESRWDPRTGVVDQAALRDADAVVHLAGAGVADHRWTSAYKQEIHDSRTLGTRTLADGLAALPAEARPRVFLSCSAIGYYGGTGMAEVDETGPAGSDFLAEVCVDWEAAAEPARQAGIRTVHPRMGIVVAAHGGAFGRIFPLARAGLGGPMGSGRQYWSIVSLPDAVAALRHAIDTPELSGPVNITSPQPVTNGELAKTLGRILHRPSVLAVPGPALKLALGEFAESVLYSQRVLPARLVETGFQHQHPTTEAALRSALDPA
jgi:uncharacterized protein